MARGVLERGNRNVRCRGRTTIRDARNLPILDADGARQYKPCQNWAANGTELCGQHGGALAPTVAAARRRLLYGASDLVEILERISKNEKLPPADRIKAINSYLDRAGIRGGVDVGVEIPAWQKMMAGMFGIPAASEEAAAPDAEHGEAAASPRRKASKPKALPRRARTERELPEFEGWE